MLNSHDEWSTLKTVIVGTMSGKVLTPFEEYAVQMKLKNFDRLCLDSDKKVIEERTLSNAHEVASLLVEQFADFLKSEEIEVLRPKVFDFNLPYKTLSFEARSSGATCPRDVFFVHSTKLIEAPMSWRSRYFENLAYRDLFLNLFKKDFNFDWVCPPKPLLTSDSFQEKLTISNEEILFDAADCRRFGQDIFVQRGHTCNDLGIEWMRRNLNARVHLYESEGEETFSHLDGKISPISSETLVYSSAEKPSQRILDLFKENEWNLIEVGSRQHWASNRDQTALGIHLNMLTLKPNQVICEKNETNLQKTLQEEGVDCIPLDYSVCYEFGGAFNCWTLDVCRESSNKCLFPSLLKD